MLFRSQEEQRVLTRTNNLLKAELQRREQCRSISLWFLPGALHALLLGLFALAICLLAEWWFVQLAAVVLALAGSLAGWTLTGVGVRYFGLKERTTIRWEKR